jgi:hypothetical protein
VSLCDLCELEELAFRASARNVRFFATLPHHLMQQEHCRRSWQSFGDQTEDPQ